MTARGWIIWAMMVVALALVFASLQGCARFSDNLKQIHTAVDGMTSATNEVFHAACKQDLQECKAAGVKRWQDCPAYMECDAGRAQVNKAVESLEDALLLMDKAYANAKKKGWLQ